MWPSLNSWVVVTRYKTPKGQVIRHVYLNPNGYPYHSYHQAKYAADKMIERAKEEYPKNEWANLEAHAVKMLSVEK